MSEDQLIWCIVGGSALLLLVCILIFRKSHKKKITKATTFPELLEALGGVQNIFDVTLNGSRISLSLESKKKINKEMIKENGVDTLVISNKKITLVIGKKAPEIYEYLQSCTN